MDLTKYSKKLIGDEQERAVSPVIGVILMVAVTVILAAVIAAFVMDLGDDLGGSAPTVSADMSTDSNWDPGEDDDDLAYITHNSGDSIEEDELRVVVRGAEGNSIATLDDNNDWGDTSGLEVSTGDEAFDAGTTYTLVADSDSDLWDSGPTEDEITIQIIDVPSDSTVGESTLTVPDNS